MKAYVHRARFKNIKYFIVNKKTSWSNSSFYIALVNCKWLQIHVCCRFVFSVWLSRIMNMWYTLNFRLVINHETIYIQHKIAAMFLFYCVCICSYILYLYCKVVEMNTIQGYTSHTCIIAMMYRLLWQCRDVIDDCFTVVE